MTRILGIDPGLRSTGFGVIDMADFARPPTARFGKSIDNGLDEDTLRYVASGNIQLPHSKTSLSLPERIGQLSHDLCAVIQEYQPSLVAIEVVFVNVNPQSTLLLGQARGAALACVALLKLPVVEYTALQIKKSVVGYGRASKEQVQAMVQQLLSLPTPPQADAADALACAVCYAHGTPVAGMHNGRARNLAAWRQYAGN